MDISDQSFFLFIFIILSAFFSGVETAFISLSDIRIKHLIEENKKGIRLVKTLKDNYHRLIITILIGNNLVNITASSLATALAMDLLKSNAISIAVGAMTLIILIFGEIFPKTIAKAKNEWIAIHAAPIIKMMQYIFFPAIIALEWLTSLLAIPIQENGSSPMITAAEIKSVVNLGEESGQLEADERIMIHNIIRFGDLQAYEIMKARTHVFAIDCHVMIQDIAQNIIQQGYSRIPVFDTTPDNIVGILYVKDMLQLLLSRQLDVQVKELVRPAMFVPETILIDELLKKFKLEKVHIAMVVDEHGGFSGVITIEDILEEIVGDIYDETDREDIKVKIVDDFHSIVKGETEIEEVNRILNLGLNERDDYETISGLILSELRHIPSVGEEIHIGNTIFRVKKADQQRIIEVEIVSPQINENVIEE